MKTYPEELRTVRINLENLFIDYQIADARSGYVGDYTNTLLDHAVSAVAIPMGVAMTRAIAYYELRMDRINDFRHRMRLNMKDSRRVHSKNEPWRKRSRKLMSEFIKACVKNRDRLDLWGELYTEYKVVSLRDKFTPLAALAQQDERFDRDWRDVPWSAEPWWVKSPYRIAHGAHYSQKQEGLLAYNESVDKLCRDIQTPIAPGKYLNRFFSHALTPVEIKMWAEKFTAYAKGDFKLKILNNNEWEGDEHDLGREWVRLYSHVMVDYSCMRGSSAVKVYGKKGNHLGLAYLERPDGKMTCRSIVRFDNKEYVRSFPYTDTSKYRKIDENQFSRILEDAGFSSGDLEGIHVCKIESDYGSYVMPYIDGIGRVDERNNSFMITDGGEYDAQNTNGRLEFETSTCSECGDRCDEDDLSYIESEDMHVCESCRENEFVYAYGRRRQDYYRERDCVEVGGDWYVTEWASNHDIDCCPDCGEYFHLDDLVSTMEGLYCTGCAVELDVEDSEGNMWADSGQVVELSDGRKVHEDMAEELQAELDAKAEEGEGEEPTPFLRDHTPREANLELNL